jgi:hypothetical protein
MQSMRIKAGLYRAIGTEDHFVVQSEYDNSKEAKLTNHFVYCRAVGDDLRVKLRMSTGRVIALCLQKKMTERLHITAAAQARMTNTEWLDFRGEPFSFGFKLAFFY